MLLYFASLPFAKSDLYIANNRTKLVAKYFQKIYLLSVISKFKSGR